MQTIHRTLAAAALLTLAAACSSQENETRASVAEEAKAPAAAKAPPAATTPAVAVVGQPAPDFTLTDLDGNEVSLSDYSEGTVVLEWFNPGCPFVVRAHEQGELATWPGTTDVTWLAINSGAEGKQGHGVDLNKEAVARWNMDYPVLIDESGEVGHAYSAKTTPHMYVIQDGVLVYAGAIDDDARGTKGADRTNYVAAALANIAAGQPVATPETKPYGCSVKYAK